MIKDIKVVFISGPFRGKDSWEMECNIRRAEELALKVWKLAEEGYKVCAICPHANTRFFQGAAKDDIWLDGDLAMLAKCDALLTTDDWERSVGSKAEVEFSKQNNIPVYHSIEELKRELVWKRWVKGARDCSALSHKVKIYQNGNFSRKPIEVSIRMEEIDGKYVSSEYFINCWCNTPVKNGDRIYCIDSDKWYVTRDVYVCQDDKCYKFKAFQLEDLLAVCADKVWLHRASPYNGFDNPIEIFIRFGEKNVRGKYDFVNCWSNTPIKNGDRIFRGSEWYVIKDVVLSQESKHCDLYKFKYPCL